MACTETPHTDPDLVSCQKRHGKSCRGRLSCWWYLSEECWAKSCFWRRYRVRGILRSHRSVHETRVVRVSSCLSRLIGHEAHLPSVRTKGRCRAVLSGLPYYSLIYQLILDYSQLISLLCICCITSMLDVHDAVLAYRTSVGFVCELVLYCRDLTDGGAFP